MDSKSRRQALASLSADEFEWLVHAIIQAEQGPDVAVRKLRPPDGGADTLVLRADGSVRMAVQAKRHNDRINWAKCEQSLRDAMARWRPEQVRFVFSRDFTEAEQGAFQSRIASQAPTVRVEAWTLSDIERHLDLHPSIAPRFLGPDARSITAAVERAARLGGLTLSTTDDLLARARELGRFGDELDPHFVYSVFTATATIPQPKWDVLPYVVIEATDGDTTVQLAAWPRPGHDKLPPAFRFADDALGRVAKENVRRALAAGRAIQVREGIEHDWVLTPRIVADYGSAIRWTTCFTPSAPMACRVACTSPHGDLELDLFLRAIPPHSEHAYAFAALHEGVWFELAMTQGFETTGRVWLYLETDYGSNATVNAAASRALLQWATRTSLRLDGLITLQQEFDQPASSETSLAELREKMDLFAMTVDLERAFQRSLRFPDPPTVGDVRHLRLTHEMLTTGRGTWKQKSRTVLVPPHELPRFAEEVRQPYTGRSIITSELFGEVLNFGPAEYKSTGMRITNIQATGADPRSLARVVLEPIDEELEWRLTNPPRCAAAAASEPATGRTSVTYHSIETLSALGIASFQAGDFAAAVRTFEEVLAIAPDEFAAWYNKGIALGALDRCQGALDAFEHAIALDPESSEAWYNKGVALADLNQLDEALLAFDRAVKLNPADVAAWLNKGISLAKVGRHEEALQAFDALMTLGRRDLKAWHSKGVALFKLGRYEEALVAFNEALSLSPNHTSSLYPKGLVLGQLGRHEEALAALHRTTELDGNHSLAWHNKGIALSHLGRLAEAEAAFARARDLGVTAEEEH